MRAIGADERIVDCIQLKEGEDVHDHPAELVYWITPAERDRGSVSLSICNSDELPHEFLDGIELDRVYAEPYEHNHASHPVLEKAGFELEGF